MQVTPSQSFHSKYIYIWSWPRKAKTSQEIILFFLTITTTPTAQSSMDRWMDGISLKTCSSSPLFIVGGRWFATHLQPSPHYLLATDILVKFDPLNQSISPCQRFSAFRHLLVLLRCLLGKLLPAVECCKSCAAINASEWSQNINCHLIASLGGCCCKLDHNNKRSMKGRRKSSEIATQRQHPAGGSEREWQQRSILMLCL